MAGFNGSGSFIRSYSWTNDANAGIDIRSDRMDTEDNGFATGLSTCITKDGQQTVTANIPFAGFKLTNIGDGTLAKDAVNVETLQSGSFVYGGTSSGTNTITFATTPTTTAYAAGQRFNFIAGGTNTGATTANINSIGAKNVYQLTPSGISALVGGEIQINQIVEIEYDGTQFQMLSPSALVTSSNNPLLTTEGTIASATTTDLGTISNSNIISITGTTTITGFGSSASAARPLYFIRFTGILTLTYNASSLIIPGSANITTAAGDTAIVKYEGSGNWRIVSYTKASGLPINTTSVGGFVNKFRNGTMDIWQRGTSLSISTAAYSADGWIIVSTGAASAITRTATNTRSGAVSTYSLLITGAASVTDVLIKQRIESYIAQQLEGQTVTVQAQVYNATGGTITPTLTVKNATAQDNWGATTTQVNAVSLQACSNTAWTQVSYTFTASSSTGLGLEVTIDFGNNFSTNGKSVQVTELSISAISSAATVIETRPIATEIAFCNRYVNSTFGNFNAPAQNFGLAGALFAMPISTTTGALGFQWNFPVPMRSTPTITTYSPGAASANWRNVTGGTDYTVNVDPDSAISTTGVMIGESTNVMVINNHCYIHAFATSEL